MPTDNHRDWYARFDKDLNLCSPLEVEVEKARGAFLIEPCRAYEFNNKGYSIAWTVNSFEGQRRTRENLKRILSWPVDIDTGNKPEMLEKIIKIAYPSKIVETKKGFHLYYDAVDASVDSYAEIVVDRLCYYFGADESLKDVTKLLRVPGFDHLKNPSEPFLVKEICSHDVKYTEAQMRYIFKLPQEHEDNLETKKEARKAFEHDDGLWDRIYNLDCEEALLRISGADFVGYEAFTFSRSNRGKKQIIVNGKGTGCWLDKEKRIGSTKKGGPTISNWIRWYGHTWSEVVKIMKKEFPELWTRS